ncbi:magnesium transporter MgtE N-terminal domain-containing protein [Nanchangia anserum]|uniref:magnesium transporter MgtE N-terminal domain-containing protein n=1 Tax=Nanchangia anserum TaxID=2692125 RepID=UPI001D12048D|nr:CBS domain-containing protein [Nanchangia anserum]
MARRTHSIRSIRSRVFIGKLAGTSVFDPIGDAVGRISDAVVTLRFTSSPRVIGFVIEVATHRRVFLPITRVTAIKPGAVITTGLINIRQFSQRPGEATVFGELLDRVVMMNDQTGPVKVLDMAMEQDDERNWVVTHLYVRRQNSGLSLRRGETFLVSPEDVSGLAKQSAMSQEATTLLSMTEDLKAADFADLLADLPETRRNEVAHQLTNERLADILEELGEDDRVGILSSLDVRRAGDVLDAMQPDDAADLIAEMPPDQARILLAAMEPEEAADVRRLMAYGENTAGGMMTPSPVILPPDANVATLLAHVRREDIPPALAALIIVSRPPLEAPTGRYLGVVHIQRALREPPQTALGTIIDDALEGVDPNTSLGTITRLLATYNLTAIPVVDSSQHVLGAVSVDDVLDHLLPDDWRDADEGVTDETMNRSQDG